MTRAIGGNPRPWHPLGLPFEEMEPDPQIPLDRDARPSLDEVLELRAERAVTIRWILDENSLPRNVPLAPALSTAPAIHRPTATRWRSAC